MAGGAVGGDRLDAGAGGEGGCVLGKGDFDGAECWCAVAAGGEQKRRDEGERGAGHIVTRVIVSTTLRA